MNRDQWHRLERWLKLFSHGAVQQYPHLILLRCWLDMYHWYRLDSLVKDLDRADLLLETSALKAREAGPLKAEVAAMRSNLAYWILEPSHGVALAEQALRDSPDGHECTQTTAIFGWGPLCQMLGEAKQGERILWDHMEDGRYQHPSSQARLMLSLCIVYWPEAETRKLQQAASRLLQISLEHEFLWNHSFARYFLGLIHYERNELNEAVAQFEIIVGNPYRFPIQNVTHCSFLLSLSYQALGLPDQARKVVESITKLTFELGNQLFIDLSEAFQADLDLLQGRIAQAGQWARAFVAPAPHGMQRFFNAELTSIRVIMARNTPQSLKSAAEQLDLMHKLLGRIHHRRLMIDVLGMKALLADALNQESTAFEKLSEALTLAEPGEFIRPFLDLGHQMSDLLKRLARQKPDLKYTERILAAFSNEETGTGQEVSDDQSVHRSFLPNQALVEPLTKREIEILLILSKRLSNHEIAERLFISPETVKRHLYNIFQKFDVKTRKQAIAKAKSLGIL
jgi:LuxR family maltose regulon positive regulatory protein